ncbi:uncharacterized protein LOC115743172 [Rhodamnia argentea]|uniref:Uncharacterized protein LOC115743172 n=1 Tax=Rhodamnia argentea TaxID=178133 RepID=A0A8B8PHU1_9MYRT|nr:uncharacterized protein LOC115743172 [Rhodamnia argentea]
MKGTGNVTNVSWVLAFLLWLVSINGAWGQGVSPSQCQDEIRKGISTCMAVAMGQPPSAACCALVRVAHAECVCPLVTPEVAAMIDVNRAKKLAEGCGRKIPPNFKCGSITIP